MKPEAGYDSLRIVSEYKVSVGNSFYGTESEI
jgi:hypothetical protein